jgi:hypothetical protein
MCGMTLDQLEKEVESWLEWSCINNPDWGARLGTIKWQIQEIKTMIVNGCDLSTVADLSLWVGIDWAEFISKLAAVPLSKGRTIDPDGVTGFIIGIPNWRKLSPAKLLTEVQKKFPSRHVENLRRQINTCRKKYLL